MDRAMEYRLVKLGGCEKKMEEAFAEFLVATTLVLYDSSTEGVTEGIVLELRLYGSRLVGIA